MATEFKHTRTRKTAFTPLALDALKPDASGRPFEVAEPGGLRLVVGKSSKTWVYRYRSPLTGKASKLTIGRYPGKGLAEARTECNAARARVQSGSDPQAERKLILADRRAAPTVGALIAEYVAGLPEGKRTRHLDASYLKNDVEPLWGNVKVTAVTRRDVKALIARKAEIAPVSAGALLGYVRRLLQYAVELEHIEINPAADLRPPARARQRQRNLSPDEIRQFWRVLPSLDASEHVRLVLRFALLTGQRIGEILQLRWTDIEGDWWTVPAAVSKNRLAHRVYLTPMAKELLEQARTGADRGDLVWRGKAKRRPGQTAPDYALDRCAPMHVINRGLAAVDEAGARRLTLEPFRVHDLRRTAASQMAAIGIPRDIISKVLNHAERGVTAVYDRYSYDAEKMDAATRWADALRRIVDGAGAPTAPDTRTLEARLALCEAEYVAAPGDTRHAVEAVRLCFQLHRMPPRWAIDGFLSATEKANGD